MHPKGGDWHPVGGTITSGDGRGDEEAGFVHVEMGKRDSGKSRGTEAGEQGASYGNWVQSNLPK